MSFNIFDPGLVTCVGQEGRWLSVEGGGKMTADVP